MVQTQKTSLLQTGFNAIDSGRRQSFPTLLVYKSKTLTKSLVGYGSKGCTDYLLEDV